MARKLRYGMVGGGRGAFIGAVHRIAAAMDQQIDLVCGAFSSDPEKSKASGADLFLPADRCYGTFEEMIKAEAKLPADKRMDFIAIVTPNHMHFPPAKMALENGFHVLSDMCIAPITTDDPTGSGPARSTPCRDRDAGPGVEILRNGSVVGAGSAPRRLATA